MKVHCSTRVYLLLSSCFWGRFSSPAVPPGRGGDRRDALRAALDRRLDRSCRRHGDIVDAPRGRVLDLRRDHRYKRCSRGSRRCGAARFASIHPCSGHSASYSCSSSAASLASCSQMAGSRSEEHTSELQSLMRISYAVFCLKKKKHMTCQII